MAGEVEVLPEAGRPDTTKELGLAGGLTLDEIKSVGTLFFQSGMFKDVKGIAQAVTKVMAGQELGIPPMQAMRGIHVVDGMPQLSAGLIGALVKRSGRYDYRIEHLDATRCDLAWFEHGQPVGSSSFTLEQAKQIPGKDGKKLADGAAWRNYTEDMLFARALTRGARRHCPDVFGGSVYTLGEAPIEADDMPQPFIQKAGDYKPPRVATLHEDSPPAEGAETSYSASEAAGTGQPEESNLFDPAAAEAAAEWEDQA